jgi:hypothetical protein
MKSKLRYKFDTFMAKGGFSIFISLTVVFIGIFLLLAILRGILVANFPIEELKQQHDMEGDWAANAYIVFLELTDPGNMAQDIESSPVYKILAVTSGIAGVIMFSALIAFITTALDQKITELKRGHSKVIEDDHTLILGWNEQRVVEIIRELLIANESEDSACVVIMADEEKERMDEILRRRLPKQKNTRIVTRSGHIASLANLDIVSVESCKAIIVLADCDDRGSENEKTTSDAKVIQTLLALSSLIDTDDAENNIVAEIFNETHRNIILNSFSTSVSMVDTCDILAKILVQTSRSVGLSVVYNEILSFDGCEMYFYHADWGDITFEDLVYHFPDGVPLGIRHGDGSTALNPDVSYKLKKDDDILIVADDDSTIEFLENPVATPEDHELNSGKIEQRKERELILGWTEKVPIILEQYADYVEDGSSIDIMIQSPTDDQKKSLIKIKEKLDNIEVNFVEKDRLDIDDLMSIDPFTYDNIIILSEGNDDVDDQKVDSENIVSLLLFRDIFSKHPDQGKNTKLITEILDSQNHPLISKAGVKDIIISNRLVSMVLAQVSENHDIKAIYDDIFEEDGSEIYIKPAGLYFKSLPVEMSFATIIRMAQKRKEVCFGFKTQALEEDADKNYGVELIPLKDKMFTITDKDSLVVLSEDET